MDGIFANLQAGDQEATLAALKHYFSAVVRTAGGAEDYTRWMLVELVVRLSSYLHSRNIPEKPSDHALYSQMLLAPNPFLLQKQIYDLFEKSLVLQKRQRRSRSSQLVERACAYIREHYQDPELNLQEVSGAVELSSVYFCTLFKKEKGITFTDYLNNVRVEGAKRLLTGSGAPMKMYEISERAGYSNPKYFYQIFRRLTGQSPKQYAQNCAAVEAGTAAPPAI